MRRADSTSHWGPRWPTAITAGLVAAAGLSLTIVLLAQAPATTSATTQPSDMSHHFADVTLVHEAVIRGDLAAVRAPATRLTLLSMPPGLPASSASYLTVISLAARRAMNASSLSAAARATATMLQECGACHRRYGVLPAPRTTARPDVGGLVGHMLEHQRAADQLFQGLVIPSAASWQQGMRALEVATLSSDELPADPKLTRQIRQAERDVHAIAAHSTDDETRSTRAETYGKLLATCATCHSLHRQIWGPGTSK